MHFLKRHVVLKEMILYGLIGGLSAAADSAIYYTLTRYFFGGKFFSNFISINVGITVSFFLNTYVNFKKKDKVGKRAVSFYIVGYIGLLLSMLVLYIGSNVLHINDFVVKILSVIIVAIVQFLLNKLITFGKI